MELLTNMHSKETPGCRAVQLQLHVVSQDINDNAINTLGE
jgi:hypothetical protein